ncbi:GNAT family N-acetyltransferase [Streptomyces sp. NPDC058861]|uniref:GNAT family N-acetyltransferase n=1 Tax=Streptomyces sp. NPDC058861 TaxID=3346653 RepID=UPI0036AF4A8E
MTQSAAASGTAAGCVPRPASVDAAAGITRLRSRFVLSEPLGAEWLGICRDQLASRLRPEGDARAWVVDAPGGELAARIHVVATEPAHQRRGLARAAVSALLETLGREGATLYELHASVDAAPLYEEFGFARDPALMRMTRIPQARDGGTG